MVARHEVAVEVLGPWSLATSRAFWEGFPPAALPRTHAGPDDSAGALPRLHTVFRVEHDGSRAQVDVRQHDQVAQLRLTGDGDLDEAATQVCRFLSLDVDARAWPGVAERDPVIAAGQDRLPGLRPCGFHSPYEAAAWAVLSQRVRIVQAAALRDELVRRHGDDGAFPAPAVLRSLELDLPGRKAEYLHAVADATLQGRLDGRTLRALEPAEAVAAVQEVKGLGPFAAELVVLRGANAPDALPRHERRLAAEVSRLYGPASPLDEVGQTWRPYRTWAAVLLRALAERRTSDARGPQPSS